MKYFTKDWFAEREGSNVYFLMKPEIKAENYDEEYFQSVYQSKLDEDLSSYLDMSKLTVDDVFPAEIFCDISTIDLNGHFVDASALVPPEELERVKEDIRREMQEARAAFVPVVYDEDEITNKFRDRLVMRQSYLEDVLPEDIIKDVADIRLLALDLASPEINERICQYCIAKEDRTYQVEQEYQTYYKEITPLLPEKIRNKYGFHDCHITRVLKKGKEVTVEFDIRGGQTSVNKMIFHNASILEEEDIIGASWIMSEIYLDSDGYEFHAALQGDDGKIRYFTVKAKDADFELMH